MEVPELHRLTAIRLIDSLERRANAREAHEIIKAVEALNSVGVAGADRELTFSLDRRTGRPVIRLVDRQTGETIRQIPEEGLLRLAADLRREETSRAGL